MKVRRKIWVNLWKRAKKKEKVEKMEFLVVCYVF